jgi:hypothetical protein
MPDPLIDIADAVTDQLNAGSWPQQFTAVRRTDPSYKPFKVSELSTLRVSVVPLRRKKSMYTRAENQGEYQVGVGFQKKANVGSDGDLDNTIPDAIQELVGEVEDSFLGSRLNDYAAGCTELETEPPIPEHLLENAVVTIPITLLFKVIG